MLFIIHESPVYIANHLKAGGVARGLITCISLSRHASFFSRSAIYMQRRLPTTTRTTTTKTQYLGGAFGETRPSLSAISGILYTLLIALISNSDENLAIISARNSLFSHREILRRLKRIPGSCVVRTYIYIYRYTPKVAITRESSGCLASSQTIFSSTTHTHEREKELQQPEAGNCALKVITSAELRHRPRPRETHAARGH